MRASKGTAPTWNGVFSLAKAPRCDIVSSVTMEGPQYWLAASSLSCTELACRIADAPNLVRSAKFATMAEPVSEGLVDPPIEVWISSALKVSKPAAPTSASFDSSMVASN
eukprot:Skav201853  [mRNA]  locus=scaffold484:333762:334677:+ [translate_table: standard]